MGKIKLLVSGLPNTGKTTLLSTLEDVLIIARDGKRYPFPQPHVNVDDFTSVGELLDTIYTKVKLYEEKMGKYPSTIAIDSVSKILLDIEGYVLAKVKSFPYGEVNKEIKQFVDFIERDLAPNFNIVMVSHAMYDEDTLGYKLVNAGGSYGKKGGLLSEVDEAIFLELKGKKRVINYRNAALASRTTVSDLPESTPIEEFNLQEHVNLLSSKQENVSQFSL